MCVRRYIGVRPPRLPSGGKDRQGLQSGHVDGRDRENLHLPTEESQRLVAVQQIWRADSTYAHEHERIPIGRDVCEV